MGVHFGGIVVAHAQKPTLEDAEFGAEPSDVSGTEASRAATLRLPAFRPRYSMKEGHGNPAQTGGVQPQSCFSEWWMAT